MTKTAEQIVNHSTYYNHHVYFAKGWGDRLAGYEYFNPHILEDKEIEHLPHYARIALEDYAYGWNSANAKINERRNTVSNGAVYINDWI